MDKPRITTITLSDAQRTKVQQLMSALGVSRNRVIGMLVEGAKVPKAPLRVKLKTNSAEPMQKSGAVQ
jgi:hypothetical protein